MQNARDPAERQARRAEADDLPILGSGVTTDDVNRIGGGGDVIERAIEPLERVTQMASGAAFTETGHEETEAHSDLMFFDSAAHNRP